MLNIPASSPLSALQTVAIESVAGAGGEQWRADRACPVLVLGDSYTNIFSSEDLGWGSASGFAEQLSRSLGCRVDKLARNDSGAKSARDMVRTEAARNPGWLDHKKVLVWVMAAREFVRGDWSHVNLEEGKAPIARSRFFVVPPGQPREVEARIVSHGPLPVAGNSPYADYLTAVHLTDLRDAVSRQAIDGDALAYLCTMRDHRVISSPDMVEGAYIRLRLSNYEENADKLDPLNRGEIDDVEVMMEEPNFAEWTSP
jgi:alginate O-acetyltransferase complex protein AlgJ